MYITIKEAAKRLSVSTKTITRRIADGTIQTVKLGKAIRISEDDLANALKSKKE